MSILRASSCLSFLLGLFACGSSPTAKDRDTSAPASAATEDFTFVFLKSGPRAAEWSREELGKLVQGHFANMARLAAEGELVLAGPLGPPRLEPEHRGIFVFDTDDAAAALQLGASDPCVEAGVFELEAHAWRATAGLRRLPELDAALVAALPEEKRGQPGATARPYVLVRCADGAAMERALAPLAASGKVPVFGHLTGTGGALFALDAQNTDEARQLLDSVPDVPDCALMPWFASRALLEL